MPQAIERSLATPMTRPCLPAIRPILFSFRLGAMCGDRAGAPCRLILHEAGRPGEQPHPAPLGWPFSAERHSGRGDAANPESIFQRPVFMDSGLAALASAPE